MTFEMFRSSLLEFQGGKIKFAVKVWKTLQFVREHPECAGMCGAMWLGDGPKFMTNAAILGSFLDIKPNSVNTNFRLLGFEIEHSKVSGGSLPNAKKWKVRVLKGHSFTANSEVAEIEKIPMFAGKVDDSLPPAVESLVENDLEVNLACKLLLVTMNGTREYANKLFTAVAKVWASFAGDNSRCSNEGLAAHFRRICGNNQATEQVVTNMMYLLNPVQRTSVRLSDFLEFSIKYGVGSAAVTNVRELTASDGDGKVPRFVPWFRPGICETMAVHDLATSQSQWAVHESSVAGRLLVSQKVKNAEHTQVLSTIVCFKALPDPHEKHFSLLFDPKFASNSLKDLLIRAMHLVIVENPPLEVIQPTFVSPADLEEKK